MDPFDLNRRELLLGVTATAAAFPVDDHAGALSEEPIHTKRPTASHTFTKSAPPAWLLDFWKEIDNKTWGNGFDCFAPNAIANLGVSDWHGREAIRENLRAFVDKGFTAHHDVVEYWDGGFLKVFRGFVTMTSNDPAQKSVRPAMTHFFYMDEKDPSKVAHWHGSVGPVQF